LAPLPPLSLHSPPMPWWLLPCHGVNYMLQQLDGFPYVSSEPTTPHTVPCASNCSQHSSRTARHLKVGLTCCSRILVTTHKPMPTTVQEERMPQNSMHVQPLCGLDCNYY
jgi:hypothetical protein